MNVAFNGWCSFGRGTTGLELRLRIGHDSRFLALEYSGKLMPDTFPGNYGASSFKRFLSPVKVLFWTADGYSWPPLSWQKWCGTTRCEPAFTAFSTTPTRLNCKTSRGQDRGSLSGPRMAWQLSQAWDDSLGPHRLRTVGNAAQRRIQFRLV